MITQLQPCIIELFFRLLLLVYSIAVNYVTLDDIVGDHLDSDEKF